MITVSRVQATTGAVATVLAAGDPAEGALIANAGTTTVYLDGHDTPTSAGFPLAAGKTLALAELARRPLLSLFCPLYAVCPDAALDLRVLRGIATY